MEEKQENKEIPQEKEVVSHVTENKDKKFKFNYDKHYKKMLLIPVILMLLSIGYIFYFYSQTGEFIVRDISLSGGTTITLSGVFLEKDLQVLEQELKSEYGDISFRELTDQTSSEK